MGLPCHVQKRKGGGCLGKEGCWEPHLSGKGGDRRENCFITPDSILVWEGQLLSTDILYRLFISIIKVNDAHAPTPPPFAHQRGRN